jgi:hypothetical protein
MHRKVRAGWYTQHNPLVEPIIDRALAHELFVLKRSLRLEAGFERGTEFLAKGGIIGQTRVCGGVEKAARIRAREIGTDRLGWDGPADDANYVVSWYC